jgi:transcriptional regulator with XRE-family HTH domain
MIERALKLVREFHRLNQSTLADRLGISQSYLSEVESGIKAPTIDLLRLYAHEFEIPVSTFLILAERLEDRGTSKQRTKADRVLQFLEWVIEDESSRGKRGSRPKKTA